MELWEKFNKIADRYIKIFAGKEGLEFNYWAADEVGGIAFFGDFCFSYDAIRLDIDYDVPKGEIIKWYDFALEQHYTENKEDFALPTISYRNWLINEGYIKRNNDEKITC